MIWLWLTGAALYFAIGMLAAHLAGKWTEDEDGMTTFFWIWIWPIGLLMFAFIGVMALPLLVYQWITGKKIVP